MRRNALLSVYDKNGISEFAQALQGLGFTIYASGGTHKHLTQAGLPDVHNVAELVGGEAILGHRVVTLSREVHAGLLSRNLDVDIKELEARGIPRLDLVCVDLYPLETEIAKEGSTRESVIEMTDIGGPTMLRSGAKGGRIVICDPYDRLAVINWLVEGGKNKGFLEYLAAKAEFVVSRYVLASARYLSAGNYEGLTGRRVATCKYGENAIQTPSNLYSSGTDDPLALERFHLIEGAEMSFTNFTDLDRAIQSLTHIGAVMKANFPASNPKIAVAVKHGNACGAAIGDDESEVLSKTLGGDPLAVFGGFLLTNFQITGELAATIGTRLDGIAAPGFEQAAINKLRRKEGRCRFIENPFLENSWSQLDSGMRVRAVRGGFLTEPNYTFVPDFSAEYMVQHGTQPRQSEQMNMALAWAICATSNSNTITLVRDRFLIGNGVGQQDRVGAAKLAVARADRSNHSIPGAVAASDSFFPFPDGVEVLEKAGVSAILTTSGSVNDDKTIDLCRKSGVALWMMPDKLGRGFYNH